MLLQYQTRQRRRRITWAVTVGLWLVLNLICVDCAGIDHYDTKAPIVKRGAVGTYFGFSVAQHGVWNDKGDTASPVSWILVGAPLADNPQTDTARTGVLFKCALSSDNCTQVTTDTGLTDPEVRQLKDEADPVTFRQYNRKVENTTDQWMGVTVRSGGIGQKVVVCGHRHRRTLSNSAKCLHRKVAKNNLNSLGTGLCYLLPNDLRFTNATKRLFPTCDGLRNVSRHFQMGVSAAMDKDRLWLGGPSGREAIGYIMEFHGEEPAYEPKVSQVHLKSNFLSPDMLAGMAMTTGYFLDKSHVDVAIGAPRGASGAGRVLFLYHQDSSLIGKQIGSNYGYALLTADVNGDSLSDLLVAAPQFMDRENSREVGAVYIYTNDRTHEIFKHDRTPARLLGTTYRSGFGLAMANLGDITNDKCDDIAIGAPYDGTGAVYIFIGSKSGLIAEPSQVIRAEQFLMMQPPRGMALETFGYSLSGGLDMDGNSYADLLVGAYGSDAVVALLARPWFDLTVEWDQAAMTSIDPQGFWNCAAEQTNLSNKANICFAVAVCTTMRAPRPIGPNGSGNFSMNYSLRGDARVFFDNIMTTVNGNQYLELGKPNCVRHNAFLQESTRDMRSPMKFHLEYILDETMSSPSPRPIFGQKHLTHSAQATFLIDCGAKEICESQLSHSVQLHGGLPWTRLNASDFLLLGHYSELKLTVTVTNHKSSAYETELIVTHDQRLALLSFTWDSIDTKLACRKMTFGVLCPLGNPLLRNASRTVTLRFDPQNLHEQNLDVCNYTRLAIDVRTSSLETKPQNQTLIKLHLGRNSTLVLGATSMPELVMYDPDQRTAFNQTFVVLNVGPSDATDVVVLMMWPRNLIDVERTPQMMVDGKPVVGQCVLLVSGKRADCSSLDGIDDDDIEKEGYCVNRQLADTTDPAELNATAQCNIASVNAGKEIRIVWEFWLSTNAQRFLAPTNITSSMRVLSPWNPEYSKSLNTQVWIKRRPIPLWMWIASVLCGLLCIAAIAYVLQRSGFFERKRVDPVELRETTLRADAVRRSMRIESLRKSMATQELAYMPMLPDLPETS